MKRFFSRVFPSILPALAVCLFPLAAGATPGTPGLNASGPAGGVWGVMTRHSEVARIGARGIARIVRQNDSGLGLTCFDRALALSARLGGIYTDVPPPNIKPAAPGIFDGGNLYNIYAGIGLDNDREPNMLVNAYAGALTNALDTYMGNNGVAGMHGLHDDMTVVQVPSANFAGSITDGMGATRVQALPLYSHTVKSMLVSAPGTGGFSDTLLASLPPALPDPLLQFFDYRVAGTAAEQMTAALRSAYGALEAAKGMTSSNVTADNTIQRGIPDYYGHLVTAMTQRNVINTGLNDLNDGVIAAFNAAFVSLDTGIMGWSDASLSGLSAAQLRAGAPADLARGCGHISFLFGGIPGNRLLLKGVTRGGPDETKPFHTYSGLVTATIPGTGPDIQQELGGGGNAASIRALARDDLINVLRLPGTPTSLSSWTLAPPVPQGALPSDVVGLMP